jgi:uncharacterized protein
MKHFLLLGLCACLSACVSPQKIPPVSQTGDHEIFVWHDLVTTDYASTRDFYGNLFGWDLVKVDGRYTLITKGEIRIGGLILQPKTASGPQSAVWLCSVKVDDINESVSRIRKQGGKILRGPERVSGRGTLALFEDPQGAVLELVEVPVDLKSPTEPTSWVWHELVTEDVDASVEWYSAVFELTPEKSADGKRVLLRKDGEPLASVSENLFGDTRNQWIPVLAVENLGQVIRKVEGKGGRVVIPPTNAMNQGQFALLLDPNSAPLLIQRKGGKQ